MIESFKSFARKSPLIAGSLIGAVAVCILFLLGSLLTGPKTEFGSAAAILKEDYDKIGVDENYDAEADVEEEIFIVQALFVAVKTLGKICLVLYIYAYRKRCSN